VIGGVEAGKALQQMSTGLRGALVEKARTRQLTVLFWRPMSVEHPAGMRLRASIGMVAHG
jgi:hypothetical protein